MVINTQQLLSAYEDAQAFVNDQGELLEKFGPIAHIFEEKKKKADAVIMIYGVYNAGKSTLINALLGKEVAATDDVPLTDRVSAYPWRTYDILDTPGVDAPIEHENVTREHMLKADVVIFVVDPLGTAEELKTLQVLMDLVQEGKQVFLVFNEKKPLPENDYIRLKDQTRLRLQELAAARCLVDVLKDIPMVKINAKRALQGYLNEQPKLVELSGLPMLEKQLIAFLQNISSDEIYGRLKLQLSQFLQEYVQLLQGRAQSGAGRKYDKLLRNVGLEKSRLAHSMARELSRQRQRIHDKSKACIRTSPDDCQTQIEKMMMQAAEDVCTTLTYEVQAFVATIENEIDEVQSALPHLVLAQQTVKLPDIDAAGGGPEYDAMASASSFDSAALKGAVHQIGSLAKPEHIVSGLKLVKDVMPTLMKGIGAKTMEKWAAQLTSKWIPYVGIVYTVGETLYSLFSKDPEEESLRKQHAEQQQANERAIQQIDDFALELADGFEMSMREAMTKEVEKFFTNIAAQVEMLRHGFNETEQANSQRLGQLLAIQQQVSDA
ncbi:50S ribosome-binding GTPase [Janthinobacterium rivuli]|uniref:50S ribosome-binding GTPase n=1 Tax=Janthinobacterium rivuli TaxID=2751478 RepID=A0ABY8I3F1_9BURK|nr:GTPase [Janthinobacterium rivuli]WFR78552.1 50S ribosome-binding GTPase [Janthinobacterium rivuli]